MVKNSNSRPRHEPVVRQQSLHGIATSVPEALSAQLFHAAQARHLKAGERLFAIGDPGHGCFLLEQGLLKATIASPLGEERIIAILGPGAIVGELSMIDGLPRSASVVAMRDCVLRFVSREALQQRANTKSETYQLLLAILATRLRQVDEDLVATTFLTVKARVARALLQLAEYIGRPSSKGHIVFQDRITLADLAAMAGVARENASRVLSEWRRRKFVTGSSRHNCIINIAAIEREMDLTGGGHARLRAGIARHVGAKLSENEAGASRRAVGRFDERETVAPRGGNAAPRPQQY